MHQKSALKIAKTIAGSSLVKSAIFGRDPNWGRIAAAAGRAASALHKRKSTAVNKANLTLRVSNERASERASDVAAAASPAPIPYFCIAPPPT